MSRVSRLDSTSRPLADEAELAARLSSLGYYIFDASRENYLTSQRVFASAEVIVGPHGAGFTNILFCKRRPLVVELIPSNMPRAYYFRLAGLLGFPYALFSGEESIGDVPWKIDQNELIDFLEDIVS